jgi:hypothetical protein
MPPPAIGDQLPEKTFIHVASNQVVSKLPGVHGGLKGQGLELDLEGGGGGYTVLPESTKTTTTTTTTKSTLVSPDRCSIITLAGVANG